MLNLTANFMLRQPNGFVTPVSVFGANLAGWYDATDSSTLSLSGSNVTQWRDKGPDANHLSQAVSAQQFVTGGTINSRAALTSGGVQHGMSSAATASLGAVFFAIKPTAYTFLNGIFARAANAGSQNVRLDSNTTWRGPTTGANSGDFTFTTGFNRVNGTQTDNAPALNTAYVLTSIAQTPWGPFDFSISECATIFSRAFAGDIGEAIVVKNIPTNAQILAAEAYLRAKWGI